MNEEVPYKYFIWYAIVLAAALLLGAGGAAVHNYAVASRAMERGYEQDDKGHWKKVKEAQ